MRKVPVRLLVSLATFCLGIGLHALVGSSSGNSLSSMQSPSTAGGLGANAAPVLRATYNDCAINEAMRISQEQIIRFPHIGNVRVAAHEDIGASPRLVFTEEKSGKEILVSYVGRFDCHSLSDPKAAGMNPKVRFKTASIRGLPQPLVIGVGMCPGGSDCAWETVAVGAVNGRLEQLTFETMTTSNDGGFFFGDLGKGIGVMPNRISSGAKMKVIHRLTSTK